MIRKGKVGATKEDGMTDAIAAEIAAAGRTCSATGGCAPETRTRTKKNDLGPQQAAKRSWSFHFD